jgi:hypothetical protein
VDPSLRATVAPVSQATHINNSGMATRRDISSRISARINSRPRDSTSSRNSTVITVNQEETNTKGRIVRHLAFLSQQLIRMVRQPQCKEEAEDVSTVENKATGHRIAQRKQLNNNQLPMP